MCARPQVRRYEACTVAQVPYQLWQAGLNVLRRYATGRNEAEVDVDTGLPILLLIQRERGGAAAGRAPRESGTGSAAASVSAPGGASAGAGGGGANEKGAERIAEKWMALPLLRQRRARGGARRRERVDPGAAAIEVCQSVNLRRAPRPHYTPSPSRSRTPPS